MPDQAGQTCASFEQRIRDETAQNPAGVISDQAAGGIAADNPRVDNAHADDIRAVEKTEKTLSQCARAIYPQSAHHIAVAVKRASEASLSVQKLAVAAPGICSNGIKALAIVPAASRRRVDVVRQNIMMRKALLVARAEQIDPFPRLFGRARNFRRDHSLNRLQLLNVVNPKRIFRRSFPFAVFAAVVKRIVSSNRRRRPKRNRLHSPQTSRFPSPPAIQPSTRPKRKYPPSAISRR